MRPINRPVTLNTIHRNHNNISDKGAYWPMMKSSTKASNVLQLISVYPYSAMRQCVFRLSETRLCALVVVSQSAGEVVDPFVCNYALGNSYDLGRPYESGPSCSKCRGHCSNNLCGKLFSSCFNPGQKT